jgi:hypothetical protein
VLGNVFGTTPGCSHAPAEINLTELQKTLDAQGIEVVNNQKESLVGRKALADKTRGTQSFEFLVSADSIHAEFKKLSDEEKLTEIKTLLKGMYYTQATCQNADFSQLTRLKLTTLHGERRRQRLSS